MTQYIKFSQFSTATLSNSNNMGVGFSGTTNYKIPAVVSWTTANRPNPPYSGIMGYNTDLLAYEFWNATTGMWVKFGSGDSGTVTQVLTGTGLTGGPITTLGTISFAAIPAHSFWANTTGSAAVPSATSLSAFLLTANDLSELTPTAVTARANLGLAIGTNVEAWSAILDQVASNVLPGTVQAVVQSFNGGSGASSATYLRGDGTWGTPAGAGTINLAAQYSIPYYSAAGNN